MGINYCSSYNYIPGKKVKGRKAKGCKIQVTQDGECISDGAGDYGNNEHCKFSFTPQQGDESTFEVVTLDTEYHWDNIEFNGEQNGTELNSTQLKLSLHINTYRKRTRTKDTP